MPEFKLHAPYKPTGDQPQAIAELVKGFKEGNQFQTLLGVTGSGKTFTMANVIQELQKPTLVIAHNKTLAAQLYGEFKEIFPENAAEYLTFITATGESNVNAVYFEENVWLTQKTMGLLYNVETHTINYHLKKIFADSELEESSVIRKFRITASDGKSYNTNHYNLKAIIAVGNKVDSERAIQILPNCVQKNRFL